MTLMLSQLPLSRRITRQSYIKSSKRTDLLNIWSVTVCLPKKTTTPTVLLVSTILFAPLLNGSIRITPANLINLTKCDTTQ